MSVQGLRIRARVATSALLLAASRRWRPHSGARQPSAATASDRQRPLRHLGRRPRHRATSRSSRATISSAMPAGNWMDADRNPRRQVAERRRLGARTTATRSSCGRSSPARPQDSQLGALYASYMDEARLEQLDAAPLKADLDRVAAIKNKAEFAALHGRQPSAISASTLFGLGIFRIRPIRR